MKCRIALGLSVFFFLVATSAAAQTVDVIRGRVTGPETLPVEGATITVTTLSGAVSRTARTDRNGRYTVTFPGGDGDYFLNVAALGYAPQRFELKRAADEDILVADARLARSAQVLDAVRVRADRARPGRNDAIADISGTERNISQAGLPPDQQGDLAAMAASLPGVLLIPGADGDPSGFSVLGLDASQNSVTLNGQSFGGSDLPRDAAISASLTTSPYDVSRGGFSGANLNLRAQSGTNFIQRTNSLNLDAPPMQWTDRAARALGQQYSNASLGGRVSGPLKYNESFYNIAYQAGRRSSDLLTLLNTNALGLQTDGIARDSVTRLLGILQSLGEPATVGVPRVNRLRDQGAVLGAFDIAPPSSKTGAAYNVTVNGSWARMSPMSNLSSALPTRGADRTNWNTGAQLRQSTFFGVGILSETTLGLSGASTGSSPYVSMPGGNVRVTSTFTDGTDGVRTLAYGGNALLDNSLTTAGIAFTNLMSWFSEDNQHRLKLSTELRRESYSSDQAGDRFGTFTYNSLADLEAGRPASFSRTLQTRISSGSQVIGAVSLGDSYRISNALQLQYGVRMDGNAFGSAPTRNALVEQLFGVRNDAVPNRFYVSPRAGFSWTYGTAAQIGGFEGAFRGPRAVVRGGLGLFQGTPGTRILGAAIDNTGLATGLQQVMCTGTSVPVPQWGGYLANPSSIPTACTDGSTGSLFSSSAPNVVLFENGYRAPRSLRSNLQWSGAVLANRFNGLFEATWSRNMNQAGIVDLNFSPVQRFPLSGEANRPVYVDPSSIDTRTGSVASRGSRVADQFNRVTENTSDLTSESRQLRATVSPLVPNSRLSWNLSYVYTSVRERVRGFGTSTVGNPFELEWARSPLDARHQVQYSLSYNAWDLIRLGWNGSFRSGTPFTPLVNADINGDGFANDRAFIYGAGTADPALASAMATLVSNSPAYVQRCLQSQTGALAARNSCQGPWTANANLSVSFNPVKLRLPQRATVSFAISNPLGAADLLLNGQDKLRGWGQGAFPDQNLLYVRGFDPAARAFRYEVNPRFGATSPALTATRLPVTVTAMMRFDIGPTREEQSLVQQLNVGRRTDGDKLPESVIRAIYASGGLLNPLEAILRQADTLELTRKQGDSVATLHRWYVIRLDSIWSPVARELAALPDAYDAGSAYASYRRGREKTVDLLKTLAPAIEGLLSEAQRRKLPPLVTSYLDTRFLASIRSGTAGGGNSFGGGVPMGFQAGGDNDHRAH